MKKDQRAAMITGYLIFGSIIGFLFNGATPQFYPTGAAIPTNTCDLLSNVIRLCVQKLAFPISAFSINPCFIPSFTFCIIQSQSGTLVLQFDILVTLITFSAVYFASIAIERRGPKR